MERENCATAVAGTSFGSPWVNNRVDPTRMAFGGDGVFVTQDTLTGAQGPAANTVDLTLTDLGSTGGASVTKIAYGTRDNPNMLVAGVVGGLWQSTTATAGASHSWSGALAIRICTRIQLPEASAMPKPRASKSAGTGSV